MAFIRIEMPNSCHGYVMEVMVGDRSDFVNVYLQKSFVRLSSGIVGVLAEPSSFLLTITTDNHKGSIH